MFGRIKQWWVGEKAWRQAHEVAFAEVAATDAEGVTVFQRRLISAVKSIVPSESFTREVAKDGIIYFLADVPGTPLKLFVYPNEAGLGNVPKRGLLSDGWRPYEEWDFGTPDELINAVVDDLRGAHAV